MKGSEKQIKWAEDIRAKMLAELDAYTKRTLSLDGVAEVADQVKATAETVRRGAMSVDDASWWIDHRYDYIAKLIPELFEFGSAAKSEKSEPEEAEAEETGDVESVDVMVDKSRVFETRRGYGLILDRDHVQWLGKHDVDWAYWDGTCRVILRRESWNPKQARKSFEGYRPDAAETRWATWAAREA